MLGEIEAERGQSAPPFDCAQGNNPQTTTQIIYSK